MNRLNKTESAVFLNYRFSIFLKDSFPPRLFRMISEFKVFFLNFKLLCLLESLFLIIIDDRALIYLYVAKEYIKTKFDTFAHIKKVLYPT